MIILLAHLLAGFLDLLNKGSVNYEDPLKKEAESKVREKEEREEAETELRQKVTMFTGYNTFVAEKLDEFKDKLATAESKLPVEDTELVNGGIAALEKSFDSLKQQVEFADPARQPQQPAAEMERRVVNLRKKTEHTLTKASSLKKDIQAMQTDFGPVHDKWRTIKDNLLTEAQKVDSSFAVSKP